MFLHHFSSWSPRSFIISQIEKGRKLYGVGTHRQMCVLLDRGGRVAINGRLKSDAADMSIVPRIAELADNLRSTLEVNIVRSVSGWVLGVPGEGYI